MDNIEKKINDGMYFVLHLGICLFLIAFIMLIQGLVVSTFTVVLLTVSIMLIFIVEGITFLNWFFDWWEGRHAVQRMLMELKRTHDKGVCKQ